MSGLLSAEKKRKAFSVECTKNIREGVAMTVTC